MPDRADITATSTLSLEGLDAKIDEAIAKLNQMADSTERTAKSAGTLAKIGTFLTGVFGARALFQWGKDMMGANTQIVDAARNLDVTAEGFQRLQQATHGSLSDGEFEGVMKSIRKAMDDAKEGSTEAADALKEFGASAETVERGNPQDVFLEIASGAKHATLTVTQLNKVFGDNARAVNEVFKAGGGKLREGMESATVVSGVKAGVDKKVERQVETTKKNFFAQAWAGLTGGPAMEGAVKDLEKLEELKKKVDDAKKPDADKEAKKDVIDIAAEQREYLKASQQTNISIESRRNMETSEILLLQAQLAIAVKQKGENSIAAEQLRAHIHDRWLAFEALDFELEWTKKLAEQATQLKESELQGNTKLNQLLANRVNFEKQIADAMRNRRFDVAEQLRKQERLNELEIKARDLMKPAAQRQQELKEAQKFEQAQRTVVAREKDIHARAEALRKANPRKFAGMTDDQVLGRVDSRDRISKATAKARADFAAMQKQGPNANNPANIALQNITTATLIVTEIKTK